jgi:hypothetical protein
MRQNDHVPCSEFFSPRRGRRGGRRAWVTVDGEQATKVPPPARPSGRPL